MADHNQFKGFLYKENQDFFSGPNIERLVRELAQVDRLALFLGAGVSVSQGLPTWRQLLRNVLLEGADKDTRFEEDRSDDPQELRERYAELLLVYNDATAVGSVIRTRLPNTREFNAAIHRALYQSASESMDLQQGFARAVWDLIIARQKAGKITRLLSFNYDDIVEQTLRRSKTLTEAAAEAGIKRTMPVYSDSTLAPAMQRDDVVPVIHLHGFVPHESNGDQANQLVLSMSDYSLDWSTHWTRRVLEEIQEYQWLLVGLSFQDHHLGSLLHKRTLCVSNPPRSPVAVFSTQGKPWQELPPNTREILAEAELARLAELGVLAVPTSFFFQDAAFLREIGLHTQGRSYYTDRRRQWQRSFSLEARTAKQQEAHEALVAVRDQMERLSPKHGRSESFRAEVWSRDMKERSVKILASSEHVMADLDRSASYRLIPNSSIASVRAVMAGALVEVSLGAIEGITWRSHLAVPIYLGGEPWYDLPVGSLVISSTLGLRESTFHTQRKDVIEELHAIIPQIARILTP